MIPKQAIEKLVREFENRFGGFIATANKRKKQDNDNQWFRNALQSAYEAGKKEATAHVLDITRAAREEGARQERERVLAIIAEHRAKGFDPATTVNLIKAEMNTKLSPSTEAKGKKCHCNGTWDEKVNYVHRDDCPLGTKGVNEK